MAMNRRDLLLRGGTAAAALGAGALASPASAQAQQPPTQWHREADVVVIGSGACGLPAAIVAKEAGSSVIVVEAQPHVGGHARVSGGNMPLGGGTSIQKKYGIEDTPDLVFKDLTDWSVVQPNGFPDYRYNDREIIRAFADNSAATFEFLREHGVVFVDKPPDRQGGSSVGNSVLRTMHAAPVDWPLIQTGAPATPTQRMTMSSGNGLMQPLEAAARKAGVEYLLEHRMTAIYRESADVGPRARRHRRQQRHQAQHPRAQGRDRRDRRLDRQRQLPPHVRPAPDGGILRARRHALFQPGRQRRARRDGDQRVAVGPVQLHQRDRLRPHQARPDRLPVRLREPALACPAARCSTRRAPPACASPTGRTSSR